MKKDALRIELDQQCERTLQAVKAAQVGSAEAKKALEQLSAELKAKQQLSETKLAVKKHRREGRKAVADVALGVAGVVVPAAITVGLAGVAIAKDQDPDSSITWRSFFETLRHPIQYLKIHKG